MSLDKCDDFSSQISENLINRMSKSDLHTYPTTMKRSSYALPKEDQINK